MENKNLNYQFTVFGDFSDISPNNSRTIINLLTLYEDKNFIPSVFQEIQLDLIPSQVNNRISLSNNDGWNINIGNNRLDVSIPYKNKGRYENMDLQTLSSEAIEMIRKLLEKYDRNGNRLALNTMYIFGDKESRILTTKYNRKEKLLDFYNENNTDEWNERIMSQVNCEKFNNETLNIGTDINKVKNAQIIVDGKNIIHNGVILQMDINTTPEIKNYRFNTTSIGQFFGIAIEYNQKIYSNVQELINE